MVISPSPEASESAVQARNASPARCPIVASARVQGSAEAATRTVWAQNSPAMAEPKQIADPAGEALERGGPVAGADGLLAVAVQHPPAEHPRVGALPSRAPSGPVPVRPAQASREPPACWPAGDDLG